MLANSQEAGQLPKDESSNGTSIDYSCSPELRRKYSSSSSSPAA